MVISVPLGLLPEHQPSPPFCMLDIGDINTSHLGSCCVGGLVRHKTTPLQYLIYTAFRFYGYSMSDHLTGVRIREAFVVRQAYSKAG